MEALEMMPYIDQENEESKWKEKNPVNEKPINREEKERNHYFMDALEILHKINQEKQRN